ncbi:hypothetical protein M436DRAFT_62537 [Aureobasidium namibiae CBS 147.97]|uniref:Uncharacterized protein n=1 Tax=Aureobasidium namibiae CBS 147.97 TaxID=1043004 RepID=A0A074WPS3_9PEZI|nr:uncharacterized protein M436DRAFT_62537 [Aureobasidium namibiae CBS 147.97]KEQ75135.1 hypothetical protein M436DRAFT_62537 [Aureobasidium namibiae CBS 147.97]
MGSQANQLKTTNHLRAATQDQWGAVPTRWPMMTESQANWTHVADLPRLAKQEQWGYVLPRLPMEKWHQPKMRSSSTRLLISPWLPRTLTPTRMASDSYARCDLVPQYSVQTVPTSNPPNIPDCTNPSCTRWDGTFVLSDAALASPIRCSNASISRLTVPLFPMIPLPELYKAGPQRCGYDDCDQTYNEVVSMRQHFVKKHGHEAYRDPEITHKDHTYKKGFSDGRDLYQHMTSRVSRDCIHRVLSGLSSLVR